jgi:NitT/TauT family transport system substrate-binding protein
MFTRQSTAWGRERFLRHLVKHLQHAAATSLLLLTACSDSQAPAESTAALTPVILQTDWYAQPEHGGFYQALAKGYYAEAGLSVEIRPGANLNAIPQLVATRRVNFSVGALERMFMERSIGIPLVSLFPYFQHDPQCVLFHEESGIKSLADLHGRNVMFQAGLPYIEFMQKKLGLDLHLLPMDWSLARFMQDPQFVQQCFLTSEPLVLKRQGIAASVIPLSASGFDPYRHVYTTEAETAEHPEQVRAFIRASLRGWQDFMTGDPTPAFELIIASNPQQTTELMNEILAEMKRYSLTDGDVSNGETLGQYNKARIRKVLAQLQELELLRAPVTMEQAVAFDLLPQELVIDSDQTNSTNTTTTP